jgi:hypothetical protein
MTSFDILAQLVADARTLSLDMDDPHRDGSGRDARSPTGDDWNELYALIEAAARALDL